MESFTPNIESRKEAFIDAVRKTEIFEIPTEFNSDATDALNADIEASGVFLLGETHGVKENADIIYTLFKKFGFRNLAIEWRPELKATIDTFLKTGEIDFTGIQGSTDGRITAGHFSLLKQLHEEKILENIICFDGRMTSTWDARDEAMAKNILASLSVHPTLVVAGNLHTKTEPISPGLSYKSEDMNHPMGEHIKKQLPHVGAGKIYPLSGEFYNEKIKNFGESASGKNTQARFYKSEVGLYVFELPEAHAAIVPNTEEQFEE